MSDLGASEIVVIIALVAGWVLNELSGSFRRGEETRRHLSRALSTCIRLIDIFSTLARTNDYFRSLSNDPVELEQFRSRTIHNFNESIRLLKPEIDEVVDVYREQLPLDATTASFLRDAINHLGRISLETVSKESGHYSAVADSLNSINSLPLAMLTKMARQLAAKIGPIAYLRVRFPKKKRPPAQATEVLLASFSNLDAALKAHLAGEGRRQETSDTALEPER